MTQATRTGFVINLMAGSGLSSDDLTAIETIRRELNADVAFTDPWSGAIRCLPDLEQYDSLWIAGGDGTLSQIVNRLAASGVDKMPVIHLLPTGTGNDFAYALGIAGPVESVGNRLRSGSSKDVDCGMVVWREEGNSENRHHAFINAMGIGLDAAVAIRANALKRRMGKSSYHLAAFLALATRRPAEARILLDGSSSDRRFLMLSICNGPRAGAGFFLTPDAEIDDGYLDSCLIEDVSLWRAVRLLPRVKEGRHQGIPEAVLSRVQEADIVLRPPSPMHIDGEVVSQRVVRASVTVIHNRIRFAVP